MSAPAMTTLKSELLVLQREFWEGMKRNDAGTLSRLTADTFTMVMEDGITDASNAEIVEMMATNDMKLKSFEMDEEGAIVRELGPGVALLAYKARSNFERAGKSEEMDNYYSVVWVKKGDNWQGAAGAVVRPGEPQQ